MRVPMIRTPPLDLPNASNWAIALKVKHIMIAKIQEGHNIIMELHEHHTFPFKESNSSTAWIY